jgi:hypothetical protein
MVAYACCIRPALWPGRSAALRASIAAVLLIAPTSVQTLASASPPDPSWISGIYDDADFDDVVGIATTLAGDLGPAVPVVDPAPIVIERMAVRGEPARPEPSISLCRPRGPPSSGAPLASG